MLFPISMSSRPRFEARSAGFGLADLLIGAVIALLGLLAMSEAFIVFDLQRRVSSGGMDAQTGAATALYGIERELQQAGLGFGDRRVLGCGALHPAGSGAPAALTLAPVRIIQGANGGPDSLVILAGSGLALPVPLLAGLARGATDAAVASTLGMAAGDHMVLQEAGKPCSLVRIASLPGNQLVRRAGLDGAALDTGNDAVPAAGYSPAGTAFHLGAASVVTYSIDGASLLRSVEPMAGATVPSVAQVPAASDIVSLKAQYGFDTRPGPQQDIQVDRWSAAMIDADGSDVVGDAGDWQRIAAVRLALVARSPFRAQRQAAANCSTTSTGAANILNAPEWQAADARGVLAAMPISLKHLPDWQCYRYRVYETVIPLRNVLWGKP